MNRYLRYIAVLGLLFVAVRLQGQGYPMLHYTIADGIPSNIIYQVFRDSKGFLWLATDKGVGRYNGIKFEKFTTFDGLADNEVFFFTEDKMGRIWMGTYNGALCYYAHDSFHNARNTPFLSMPVLSPYIYTITNEEDSSVTFNFHDRTVLLNIKNEQCTIIPVKYDDGYGRHATYARKLPDGNYRVHYKFGSDSIGKGSFVIIDAKGNRIKSIDGQFSVQASWLVNQNHVYFVDSNSFFDTDWRLLRKTRSVYTEMHRLYTYYDDTSNYFVGTNDGLIINDTIKLLRNKWVVSVSQDNYGNYWIGTHGDGLYCLPKKFGGWRKFDNAYEGSVHYSKPSSRGAFFVTADASLYNLEEHVVSEIFNLRSYCRQNFTTQPEVASIVNSDNRYYSFYGKNICVLNDLQSGHPEMKVYANPFETYSFKSISIQNGYLYLQNREQILRVLPDQLSVKRRAGYESVVDLIDKDRIYCTAQNTDGSIWYATRNAVGRIRDGKNELQPQFNGASFKIFGFYSGYIVGYSHQNDLLICRDFEKNLSVDTVKKQNCIWEHIYRIDDRHLLLSTDGLHRLLTLHPGGEGGSYSIAIIEDPFIPLNIDNACADSATCYFFTKGSVTTMKTAYLLEGVLSPKLLFRQLRTARSVLSIRDNMNISFDEGRNISISVATLAPWGKGLEYQYAITSSGEPVWIDFAGERIDLVSPGYGHYTVRVRARSISTGFSVPVSFHLHIAAPFWARWWFILLCVTLALALVAVIIRLRIMYVVRKGRKAHEGEVKFMKSEYKALNALMNPHFIFNTLNNVQSLFNENDKEAANAYLRVFADLIRQNMHNVLKEVITLQKEIDLVTNYLRLEQLRFEDKLAYTIEIGVDLDLSDISVPPLLIQPIVENSIKHGILPLREKQGFVTIRVFERDDYLYIEVADNGMGMCAAQKEKDQLHESFGLMNIRKRIAQLSIIQGKEIRFTIEDTYDEAGTVTGTKATVILCQGIE